MRLLSRINRGGEGAGGGVFRPQITSLIDVMTILLFFLIKSFSVDSDIVSPPPNVELPLSTSEKAAQSRCAVTITKQEIVADDRVLAGVADVERSDSLIIEPLHAVMRSLLPVCLGEPLVTQRSYMADSSGSVVILCDRDVNFAVVKKVMSTCSRAGIANFSILVLREGE